MALNLEWYKWKDGKLLTEDWIWWKQTQHAYEEAKIVIFNKIRENQFVGGKKPIFQSQNRPSNPGKVLKQIDDLKTDITYLKKRLKFTEELNKMLEDHTLHSLKWWNIAFLVETLFEGDDPSMYRYIITDREKRERLLYSPDNKEKLERGIMFLWSKYVDDTGDIKTLSRHWNSVLTGVLRFVPWLFWVYLFDIPVSISGKIFVWADIGKSIEFMNWIQSWMEWEFEEFHQENVKKWNIPIAQNILRNLATILRLDSGQEANLLAGKFDELSKEFKELIASYVEFRLIPDLMTLQNASYNSFEQWFLIFWTDPKYKKWEKLIEMLEKGIENPETKNPKYYLKIAREVLGLLKEEWQVDSAITPTENRNNFFEGILKKDEIFGHLKWHYRAVSYPLCLPQILRTDLFNLYLL